MLATVYRRWTRFHHGLWEVSIVCRYQENCTSEELVDLLFCLNYTYGCNPQINSTRATRAFHARAIPLLDAIHSSTICH